MSKRGKVREATDVPYFYPLYCVQVYSLAAVIKKRLKSVQGAQLRKKMYETRMMGSPLTNSQISQKPILLRQNRIRPLRKMQYRKM